MLYNGHPKCSLVCVTYNQAPFSRFSIESIANQTYPNIEIIVVDDGSTDGSQKILQEALEASGRPFKFLLQDNTANVPLNFNRAIAAATGEFLSPLSLDDVLLPDCISSKMELLTEDKNLTFVFNTSVSEIDSDGNAVKNKTRPFLFEKFDPSAAQMLEYEYETIGAFYIQGTVFRTSLVRDVGGFDEDMIGDDLILRTKIWRHLIQHPHLRFALIHRPGVAYRKHGTNIHLNTLRQVKTVVQWKNRYFPERSLPKLAVDWTEYLFRQSIVHGQIGVVEQATGYDPQIADIYRKRKWKWRQRRVRSRLRRLLGIGPKS